MSCVGLSVVALSVQLVAAGGLAPVVWVGVGLVRLRHGMCLCSDVRGLRVVRRRGGVAPPGVDAGAFFCGVLVWLICRVVWVCCLVTSRGVGWFMLCAAVFVLPRHCCSGLLERDLLAWSVTLFCASCVVGWCGGLLRGSTWWWRCSTVVWAFGGTLAVSVSCCRRRFAVVVG